MPFRLWDRLRDWIVLGVLILASVIMMVAQNQPMLIALRSVALEWTSGVESRLSWVGQFIQALDENEALREENIAFSSQLALSREARIENQRLKSQLAFRDSSNYEMVAAVIVSKDIDKEEHFLALNVGRTDGVEPGMAVVDERGILGKVVLVSDHYARVMTYLNTNFRVPARIQSLQTDGLVSWPGSRSDKHLILEHIVKTENVAQGQRVVTSGFSGVFPAGFTIGQIVEVNQREGENELGIRVAPASQLSTAKYAFVVLKMPDPEQQYLESLPLQ